MAITVAVTVGAGLGCGSSSDDTRGTGSGAPQVTTIGSTGAGATAAGGVTSVGDSLTTSAGEGSDGASATTGQGATATTSATASTTSVTSVTSGTSVTSTAAASTLDTGEGSTGAPRCVQMDLGGPFEVTPQTTAHEFPLPMAPDQPYSRLEVELEFTITDWGGQCYNPYYNPPMLVPVFHKLLTLQRGAHWCKGGNLAGLELRGPGKNRLNGQVYFKEEPWGGSGCGPSIEPHAIFGGEKNLALAPGETHSLRFVYDASGGEITVEVNDELFIGTPHPEAELLALTGHPLHLVLSFENSFECFDAQGEPADDAVCCHAPSWGWVYDDVAYTLCD